MQEDTFHKFVGQKELKDSKRPQNAAQGQQFWHGSYNESIEEHLRSCSGVKRAFLAYIIRKIITVQTYDIYSWHTTPEDKIIARMLHLPMEQNRFWTESMASTRAEHRAAYKIDNRTAYANLDQIFKDK